MIKDLEEYINGIASRQATRRLLEGCKKIDQFAKAMEPFFKITDLLVSSHPEWSAIAWGAIRLVFQLSSHFVGFFEKLASMFDEFRRELPRYALNIETIKMRMETKNELSFDQDKTLWERNNSLISTLSHVYVDLLQFCHDACRLFARKKRGVRHQAKIVWDLVWTPFDDRFADIIERLKRHKQDFQMTMETIFSAEMMNHFNMMDKERKRNAEHREIFNQDRMSAERKAIASKVTMLQTWISSPNWSGPFERARGRRLDDTGMWILENEQYKDWKVQPINADLHWARNILIITAKPGYGKTVLSTRIIEDLRQHILSLGQSRDEVTETSCVFYIYFDRQQENDVSYFPALQALAGQLLYAQRNNCTFVDIGAVLMQGQSQGQFYASEQALISMIQLCLKHIDNSFLVIDGLDECSEWEEFHKCLHACTEKTSCKIVITARPHLALSSSNQTTSFKSCYRMDLHHNANLGEITAVLRPPLAHLLASGGLGSEFSSDSLDSVVNSLAQRADSIILWASLIVKYLQSSFLSPRKRAEIIRDNLRFNGLESLYQAIIEGIVRRIPRDEHAQIKKIFQILIVTRHPWTSEGLRVALAIQPNRRCTKGDFIENFDVSLIEMCGSLVEVREDYSVRFIHLSVLQYLTNPEDESTRSIFSVDVCTANCFMAKLCLDYLFNEIQHKPLSGSADHKPNVQTIVKKYHLLPYVVSFWTSHALESIRTSHEDSFDINRLAQPIFKELVQCLSRLASNKLMVTTWIEACWTFQTPPSLVEISHEILKAANAVPALYSSQLTTLGDILDRFSLNLTKLNERWGNILENHPNEIWLPSINAWSNSEFWIGTNTAKLESFSSPSDLDAKVVFSQVSADETEVGVIRIWPSSHESKQHSSSKSTHCSAFDTRNWIIEYQIWLLETKQVITRLQFEIPPTSILCGNLGNEDTQDGPSFKQERKFLFPAALSPSLRTVIILGTVIRIHEAVPQSQWTLKQDLFDPNSPHDPYETYLLRREILNRPRYPLSDILQPSQLPPDALEFLFHNWIRSVFSPCETYLFVIKGKSAPSADMFGTWILDVYQNADVSLNYQLIATSAIRFNHIPSNPILIHKTKPVLVISLLSITVMWRFTMKDKKFITLYENPLDHMEFSKCGNFLHGAKIGIPDKGRPIFLNLETHLSCIPQINGFGEQARGNYSLDNHNQTSLDVQKSKQLASELEFLVDSNRFQMSKLHQDNRAGSVILQTMRSDGLISAEMITRLPNLSTLDQSYTTLCPGSKDNENLRLVLNMALQDTYDMDAKVDFQLPAILERKKSSIPAVVYAPRKELAYADPPKKRNLVQNANDDNIGLPYHKRRR